MNELGEKIALVVANVALHICVALSVILAIGIVYLAVDSFFFG